MPHNAPASTALRDVHGRVSKAVSPFQMVETITFQFSMLKPVVCLLIRDGKCRILMQHRTKDGKLALPGGTDCVWYPLDLLHNLQGR